MTFQCHTIQNGVLFTATTKYIKPQQIYRLAVGPDNKPLERRFYTLAKGRMNKKRLENLERIMIESHPVIFDTLCHTEEEAKKMIKDLYLL